MPAAAVFGLVVHVVLHMPFLIGITLTNSGPASPTSILVGLFTTSGPKPGHMTVVDAGVSCAGLISSIWRSIARLQQKHPRLMLCD